MRQAANTHHARPCSFSRVPLAPPVPLPIEENLRCELHHLIRRARHWQSQWHGESKGWDEAESQSHAQYTRRGEWHTDRKSKGWDEAETQLYATESHHVQRIHIHRPDHILRRFQFIDRRADRAAQGVAVRG